MENLNAKLKKSGKNRIYLIIIGLTVIALVAVLIYTYVEFLNTNVFIQEKYRQLQGVQGCRDTDGGKDFYKKGTVCIGSECKTDKCGLGAVSTKEGYLYKSLLTEYYCGFARDDKYYGDSDTVEAILKTGTTCENRCEDGACVKRTNPYCIEEGGRNPQAGMAVCCSGLVAKQAAVLDCRGNCANFYDGHKVCLKCGDGLCDTKYENLCNCPEDCKEGTTPIVLECINEGGIYKDMSGAKGECCTGLHEISSGYRNGVAYCTSEVCGNGECKAKENEWNCPEDCKEEETFSADLNNDGRVGPADFSIMMSQWTMF